MKFYDEQAKKKFFSRFGSPLADEPNGSLFRLAGRGVELTDGNARKARDPAMVPLFRGGTLRRRVGAVR